MSFDPMSQFAVTKILPLYAGNIDISLTNSALYMIFTLLAMAYLAFMSIRCKRACIEGKSPSRFQAFLEFIYGATEGMFKDTVGNKALYFLPAIFSVFLFILLNDLIGMIPGSFAVMSQIIVTLAIALFLFVGMTLFGIYKHGWRFFSLFLPPQTPPLLIPLMMIIELVVYLARPFSLSLRLTANIAAGHIVLKVIASLIITSGLVGIFPFALLVVLTGFEFFVAVLQSYIFTMLLCVYLSDVINLH